MRLRALLWSLVGLGVSIFALAVLFQSIDVGQAGADLLTADPLPLVGCIGLIAAEVALRSLRWRTVLVSTRSDAELPLPRVIPVLLVGYLGNLILPARLGDATRAYLLARRENLSVVATLGSVALERGLDVSVLATLAVLAAVSGGAPVWLLQAVGGLALIGVGVLVLLLTIGFDPLVRLIRRLAGKNRLGQAFGLELEQFGTLIARAALRRAFPALIAITLLTWLLDTSVFWLVGRSLGLDVSPSLALLVAAATVLSTALPSAPAYVGTFEFAAVGTATALGIDPAAALAWAIVSHVVTIVPVAVAGAVAAMALGVRVGRGAEPP